MINEIDNNYNSYLKYLIDKNKQTNKQKKSIYFN